MSVATVNKLNGNLLRGCRLRKEQREQGATNLQEWFGMLFKHRAENTACKRHFSNLRNSRGYGKITVLNKAITLPSLRLVHEGLKTLGHYIARTKNRCCLGSSSWISKNRSRRRSLPRQGFLSRKTGETPVLRFSRRNSC